MFLSHMSIRGPFQHLDADGRPIRSYSIFNHMIEKYVEVSDVVITFGMSGAWRRRTGHGEPVRVAQPAPTRRL
jgi:hypothetical protein